MLDQEILVKWFMYSLFVTLPFFFVFLIFFNIFPKSKVTLKFPTVSIFAFILSVVAWGCLGTIVLVRAEKSFSLALTAALTTFVLFVALPILLRCYTRTGNKSFLFSTLGVAVVSTIAIAFSI
ncbi:MAG: hypothetical protein HKM07_01760 [Chlamydiae bacterium]|nr:hypothetical protein [Chlamydiota bacterium]